MNNFITQLENFEKPDINFIKNKECLICLETINIELNKILKLPCACANSVYHIICIETFLKSGQKKNFCPHCKTKYVLSLIEEPIPLPLPNYIEINRVNNEYKLKKFTEIMLFHVVSNSLMNIINLLITRNYSNRSQKIQVLALFYFCKIFLNFCLFLFSKNNIERIENFLVYSYVYQVVLIVFLIYSSYFFLYKEFVLSELCNLFLINNPLCLFSLGFKEKKLGFDKVFIFCFPINISFISGGLLSG
jgi:hypothetical protein